MKSELIVDAQPDEVSIALLEDGRLVSLQKESRDIAYAVGDIYLAKVKKLMPGLNAAFVNVGYEKDAFLHYLDLGPHFATYAEYLKQLFADRKRLPRLSQIKLLPDIDKHGSIANTLTAGQELLVQIVKEPISSKGPRLTTEITLTGRYLVLTPFADKISVSQKIKSQEEKTRLRQLIDSIKPKNYGVIVRTSAEGKKVAELNHELKALVKAFEDACAKAQRSEAPTLVFEESNRVVGMLRDVFSPSFENIHVNDPETHEQIQKYVNLIAPERAEIVKLYSKPAPIFDNFSVTRQIKSSFGKTVSFKSGAYIIIEHTEALHVIDVNSGNRSKASNDQETNALEVNLRAAEEIARQLRLRDMGGIIVVDFIDMSKTEHRQQVFDHMRQLMANDRARHNILPLSKFGLMQITRQRVRMAMDITTAEKCPSCHGNGEVQPSILFTDTLYEKLDHLVNNLGQRDFIMYIHPYVDAYIKKGFFSTIYGSWRRKLGRCFKIVPDESVAYLEYKVLDKDGKRLDLRDEKDAGHTSASKKDDKRRRGSNDDDEPKALPEPKKAEKKAAPKPEKKAQPKESQTKDKEKTEKLLPAHVEPKALPKTEEPKAAEPKAKKQKPVPKPKPQPEAKPEPKADAESEKDIEVEIIFEEPEENPALEIKGVKTLLPAVPLASPVPAPEKDEEIVDEDLDEEEDDDTEADSETETDNESPAGERKKRRRRRRRRKPSGAKKDAGSDAPASDNNNVSQE